MIQAVPERSHSGRLSDGRQAPVKGVIVSDVKRVYRFGVDETAADVTEGSASMNYVLGGKGADLAEMAAVSACRSRPATPSRARPAWSTRSPATCRRRRSR